MKAPGYRIEERPIETAEYLFLRGSTNWSEVSPGQVKRALSGDLYSVCALMDSQPVGMARVIGDGAIYFYVQDLIVLPDHQKKGLGRLLMEHVEHYLKNHAPKGAFVGLMAARDTESFYMKFGYQVRPENRPGMFKYINMSKK